MIPLIVAIISAYLVRKWYQSGNRRPKPPSFLEKLLFVVASITVLFVVFYESYFLLK